LLEIRVAESIPQDRQGLAVQDSITSKGMAQCEVVTLDNGGQLRNQHWEQRR